MSKKTIKEYLLENYEIDTIRDITEHGCVSGCVTDLIYYADTVKFHDEYEEEIWDLLNENADNQGITIMEFIVQLNGKKQVGSMYQFKNLLCWFAIEWFANEIIHELEGNE